MKIKVAQSYRLLGLLAEEKYVKNTKNRPKQNNTEAKCFGRAAEASTEQSSLRWDRKDDSDVVPVTWAGREFQTRGAATGTARYPIVERRITGTMS